uniref:Uncharacterized protein n=1 Tax=Ascaris lumbricoides TaxID=6252 RepID=A0A9J2PZN3_ASCLU
MRCFSCRLCDHFPMPKIHEIKFYAKYLEFLRNEMPMPYHRNSWRKTGMRRTFFTKFSDFYRFIAS